MRTLIALEPEIYEKLKTSHEKPKRSVVHKKPKRSVLFKKNKKKFCFNLIWKCNKSLIRINFQTRRCSFIIKCYRNPNYLKKDPVKTKARREEIELKSIDCPL